MSAKNWPSSIPITSYGAEYSKRVIKDEVLIAFLVILNSKDFTYHASPFHQPVNIDYRGGN